VDVQDLHRYKEAEELQRRAVGICDRSLGYDIIPSGFDKKMSTL
jgi:hypothetical protein